MVFDGNYPRTPRKSIWIPQDAYSTLSGLKQQYETVSGETDWGKFLTLLAGIAIGAAFIKALSQQETKKKKNPARRT